MGCKIIKFILSNARGIKNSHKKINTFYYLKNKVDSNRVLFLEFTHSCEIDEKTQNDDSKGTIFFLNGRTNSLGFAIGYSGANFFILVGNGQKCCYLLLNVTIDEQNVELLIYIILRQKKIY